MLDFCHDHLDRSQQANGVAVDEVDEEVVAVEGVSVEAVVVVIEEDSAEDEVEDSIEAEVGVVSTEAAAVFEDIDDLLRYILDCITILCVLISFYDIY